MASGAEAAAAGRGCTVAGVRRSREREHGRPIFFFSQHLHYLISTNKSTIEQIQLII